MLGLLFDGHGVKIIVELNHAKAFRVIHMVAKHGRTALRLGLFDRTTQVTTKTVPVKDIIAQYQRTRVASNKFFTDDKCWRKAIRRRLCSIGEFHSKLATITKQALKVR